MQKHTRELRLGARMLIKTRRGRRWSVIEVAEVAAAEASASSAQTPGVTPAILSLQISNILTRRARHGLGAPTHSSLRGGCCCCCCCQPVVVAESRDSFIHSVRAIISQLNCLRSSAAIKTEISPAADGA